MNREQAKEIAKDGILDVLQNLYGIRDERKAFRCIAGTHPDNNPSMSYFPEGRRVYCFSCQASFDAIDLIGMHYGITDPGEKFQKAYEYFNLPVACGSPEPRQTHQNAPESTEPDPWYADIESAERAYQEKVESVTGVSPEKEEAISEEYKAYIQECSKRITDTDYWKQRGLSQETVERYQIGYDPAWRHPDVPKAVPKSPRLIIPTGKNTYTARDTRPEIPENARPYKNQKVGEINPGGTLNLFNVSALFKNEPVFIVEGEIDALSVLEAGGNALALGSVANVKALIEYVRTHQTQALQKPALIALDGDQAGEKATQELIQALKEIRKPCYDARSIIVKGKDPNDSLIQKPEAFKEKITAWIENPAKENYTKQTNLSYLSLFLEGIKDGANTEFIPTGYPVLDNYLDGGLYEGLYFIGAISSLGKTTFTTQMADQIASQGHDVIFISLEMARTEIMAKSISRETLEISEEDGLPVAYAKTTRGITTAKNYQNYQQEEIDLIKKAITSYQQYANHIVIKEGIGDITTAHIREFVQEHINATGRRPVVIIDYVQIIAPPPGYERASDKQITDRNVTELKRISRDYKIPIIGISSFNRENYSTKVSMTAFKESGAIEYSSDVLIGLQYYGLEEAGATATEKKKNHEKIEEARNKNPREVELVILKNRNGQAGITVQFDYHPLFNKFEESINRVYRND